ncbi:hypothetical protein TEA_001869 [Camellia sinensis var. sinensis]|uniref:Uncharacterized protein n=1 Tax=Camellia sinensis var. sinensis TaxID=542762 RepID=A0A4S4DVE4_CAMSN|nr:hypothetical protein TEA_001869 [Camellia sinensis var. sinensis]
MKKRKSFELESELEARDLLQDYSPSIKITSDDSSSSISSDNSSKQLFEIATSLVGEECVSLELSVLDNDSILEHQVQEIDPIFSPNGGFTSQLLVWFPTRLDHSMACVHVCIQVVSLDPKPDYGSVCWISGWRMEMFKRCCCQVQKGRGKWMVVANMARFLSVSINELVVKMPRATIEVKELRVDISKDGGSKPALFVKLYLLPIVVHLGDPRVSYDQSSNFNHGGYTSTNHASSTLMEKTFAPFYCEELTLSSEFGHDREAGVVIKNVDITSGEVTLNLNEELFLKTKGSSDAFSHAAEVVESSVESSLAKKPQKKQATLLSVTKYASIIPEKVMNDGAMSLVEAGEDTTPRMVSMAISYYWNLKLESWRQGKNSQLPSIVSLLTQGIGHPKKSLSHGEAMSSPRIVLKVLASQPIPGDVNQPLMLHRLGAGPKA